MLFRVLVVVAVLVASPLRGDALRLGGKVVDENDAPVERAKITVHPPGLQTLSDPSGEFHIWVPGPGDYTVDVAREGYFELKNYKLHVEGPHEVTLVINPVREVFQSVDVKEQPSPVDLAQTQHEERLSGTEINDVPFQSSHSLRSSLELLPGVVQDQMGALHFNGSSENQVLYLLNGFNVTDPINGNFQTKLGVEGVRSMDYLSSRYSPEFGKGSAGVLSIRTDNGTDQFHYTATDFFPGFDIQQGPRLGNWYPRVGVSGPIVRGRAWFADNFSTEYTQLLVTGLPKGQNERSGLAGSNLLHTQFNITPSNILFADFLFNIDNEGGLGLGPLSPLSTTVDLRSRQYFATFRDQIYFGHGALLEFGYAHNYFSSRTAPQGSQLLDFSPTGRSGNSYENSYQTAARDQGMVDGYLPGFRFFGTHQIKMGVALDHLLYTGNFQRSGYNLLGLSGQVLSTTIFEGPRTFELPDNEFSFYAVDTWRLSKRLQLDLGIREDWDQQVHDYALGPRVSFAWAPFASGRTRISGGYAVTYDAVNFNMLGLPLNQDASTTRYNPNGTPAGPPSTTTFVRGGTPLELPRSTNWSLGVDHQITERLFANASYLRRRGTEGFSYVNTLGAVTPPSELPLPDTVLSGEYQLTNLRRDDYDAVSASIRQTFAGQHEWMASYTHSRTFSNTVLDLNTTQPLQILPMLRPVPWDTPNRFLGWLYLPLPWKDWSVAALADAHTGFPFSVQDQTGLIIGNVDAHRYPFNFDLNLHLERMFIFRGYRFALRGGLNNVTDQANSTAVYNTVGSTRFMEFFGNEGRHFVVRLRFFGRAK